MYIYSRGDALCKVTFSRTHTTAPLYPSRREVKEATLYNSEVVP